MVNAEDIKADLPNWPDDVIDQWLLKLANRGRDTGWPPPENLEGNAWKYILGGRPIAWWKRVAWTLEERDISFPRLSDGTRRIINGMMDGHVEGNSNLYTQDPSSRGRFLSALEYIAKQGRLPKPLIAMQLPDGLSVLDGNHRVSALFACQAGREHIMKLGGVVPPNEHQIWIGIHDAGEVPLP